MALPRVILELHSTAVDRACYVTHVKLPSVYIVLLAHMSNVVFNVSAAPNPAAVDPGRLQQASLRRHRKRRSLTRFSNAPPPHAGQLDTYASLDFLIFGPLTFSN
jgi:hypothetical protein